ncbi:MAG: penicillin acylase family protein [Halioglobus sp.]|nr:penicillin acylase family protein [Halioglobus sp.]
MIQRTWLAVALGAVLAACGDNNNGNDTVFPPNDIFSAEIRRTEYGIPHIKADDWKGLGYGYGYAYAQDNYCVTMRQVVFGTGRSAELMGEDEGSVESDLLSLYINGPKEEFQQMVVDQLPQFAIDVAEGFTRGMNRYLRETGVENLPEGDLGCRNAPWVFEFDSTDYWMFLRKIALWGSSEQGIFRRALLSVEGPSPAAAAVLPSPEALLDAGKGLAEATAQLRSRGSNGLALGRDATTNGRGILLGNPHQPWFGDGAWYQVHLTIPGEYDVAGAALHGTPIVGIGFNADLAWTHTVSYANRFSLFELPINPDNLLQYRYNGEWLDFEQETVEVLAKQPDGSMETRSYTFYVSRYGPVINLKDQSSLLDGWPMFNNAVLAFRDANLDTGPRFVEQWKNKAQATNMEQYIDALSLIGNPVFHDMAADRDGNAFYGEISAIPFVTQAQLDTCVRGPVAQTLASLTTNVILTLDGSDPACEWGTDPDAPANSNLYSAGQLPQILTGDYVGNSNNSYWLSDANNPLTGFPTIMGPLGHEGMQQFLRTRIGHILVAEKQASAEPEFDAQAVKDLMYNNRVYGAEVALDDVLAVCAMPEAAGVTDACAALAGWDRRVELDSRGAQVFTEFWREIRNVLGNDFQNVVQSDSFWKTDFDPANPLHTPAGIDLDIEDNRVLVVESLTTARDRLLDAGVALDAPWREVQFLERNDENVPIHGGPGTAGIYGAISAGLSEGGYRNPRAGNSYIQVVTWDESECPIADVILVPSQSTDPTSPHFADQTKLYAEKEWVRWRFCEDDIAANQVGDTLAIQEENE